MNQLIDGWGMTQHDNQETPFVGVYYGNLDLTGEPAFSQASTKIDFDWGDGGPENLYSSSYSVDVDNFSIRWKAKCQFSAGRYRFHTITDDGVKLWVDDNLIIDQWHDQSPTEWTGDADIDDGLHWILMEYYEHGEGAVVRLWWERGDGTITGPWWECVGD